MNRYLEIIIIVAVLSIVLASLKLAHGQSNDLTVNQTTENQTDAYDSILMGVIKNANITIPSDLHPPPTTQQLDQIVDAIVNGGYPYKILDDMRQNKS